MPSASRASSAASRFIRKSALLWLSAMALQSAWWFGAPAADAQTGSPPAGQPSSGTAPPKQYYAEVWTPRSETGIIHLHGGIFAPVSANQTGPTIGARLGINAGSHLVIGVLGDWSFQSKSLTQPSNSPLPGLQPKIVLARVDAHLIPAMVFLQVKLTDKFPIVPYAGVAAGYEWLIFDGKDYRTNNMSSVTYANVAWGGYGGIGLRLSDKLRLDSELFYNGGALSRDVTDQNGVTWKETVDVNGVGARVGLDIAY